MKKFFSSFLYIYKYSPMFIPGYIFLEFFLFLIDRFVDLWYWYSQTWFRAQSYVSNLLVLSIPERPVTNNTVNNLFLSANTSSSSRHSRTSFTVTFGFVNVLCITGCLWKFWLSHYSQVEVSCKPTTFKKLLQLDNFHTSTVDWIIGRHLNM